MTPYEELIHIDFLPELRELDLAGKAVLIQRFLRDRIFSPRGLLYSIPLITGPYDIRPMTGDDMEGTSIAAADSVYDDETRKAARAEGMTYENTIYSAGLYLQAQIARFAVTREPEALNEARRAFATLESIYRAGCDRGLPGWLGKPYGEVPKDHTTPDQYNGALIGLYRYYQVAPDDDRRKIARMILDIADLMIRRDYAMWALGNEGSLKDYHYCNATYMLAETLAYHLSADAKYKKETMRLRDLSYWIDRTYVEKLRERGAKIHTEFECHGHAYLVIAAGEILFELLPEVYGAGPDEARGRFGRMVANWWRFGGFGIDENDYCYYWIHMDVEHGTWQPTGNKPMPTPYDWGGTFFKHYSGVRMGDQAYRHCFNSLAAALYCDGIAAEARAWVTRALSRTEGQRLRWMIDLDGEQLKPDCKWMGCCLSSEAPFLYLIVYYRGKAAGLW